MQMNLKFYLVGDESYSLGRWETKQRIRKNKHRYISPNERDESENYAELIEGNL